ncbi:hypothetical protein [Metabacillus rhizolycopersici]|uniref:Uncharacterized protein n=1 Tax=Metabacillus rhizolycopersici TaxID=2875709 RepID=A0ABS7UWR1_9BACI|nr:hypothetical protein [Metabacillus rhizolycopersici]MBZ5752750.1 hypothetical protein [Metabacillus rhizolycopersici]
MADKTFGVKVSEELHDKVKELIESSGDSAKEWFEKAVAITELQTIKEGASDYSQDLTELEVHTTRIYELISNMVQRSIYIKDHAVQEVTNKLEQKESIIGEYQEKTKVAIEELKQCQESLKAIEAEKEELSKQLEESRSTNKNNQLLILEYKEKNDTLTGLVSEYKAHQEENGKLKEQLAQQKERYQSQVSEMNDTVTDKIEQINQLTRLNGQLKKDHAVELDRMAEKNEFEKEKALYEIKNEYRDKIVEINETHNTKVQELYDNMDKIRKDYEAKIENLQKQIDSK